ncbi:hypothetical protein [Caulobacter segnis]|uniref:hypothetical protein n=1 Tax=Caulobacter segnis TaxID=88688 RepID=UPI002856CA01|nr:hypothetical protein [Caulobacter segnis]MDR6625695.1 multisubunit Na+/H+ antiporter MnhG subunit [Caulobacter segnis]
MQTEAHATPLKSLILMLAGATASRKAQQITGFPPVLLRGASSSARARRASFFQDEDEGGRGDKEKRWQDGFALLPCFVRRGSVASRFSKISPTMIESPPPQPSDAALLVGLQKAEFGRAAKLRSWTLRAQLALAILAALTTFPLAETFSTLLAIVGLLLAFAIATLGLRSRKVRGHAERLRRATLFADGLGMTISPDDMRDLIAEATSSEAEGRALIDPAYFKSQAAPSPRRLGEMLSESAFWTKVLAGIASKEAWRLCVASTVLGIVVFGVSISLTPHESPISLRLFCVLVVLLLTSEISGAAFAYGDAAKEIEVLEKRLRTELATPRPDQTRVVAIVSDYNAIVEGMPPFPAGLYSRNEKTLNAQYDMWKTGPQP